MPHIQSIYWRSHILTSISPSFDFDKIQYIINRDFRYNIFNRLLRVIYNMITLGARFILDDYRGWNFWSPHYPLLYVNSLTYRQDRLDSMWKDGYVYTLGVL